MRRYYRKPAQTSNLTLALVLGALLLIALAPLSQLSSLDFTTAAVMVFGLCLLAALGAGFWLLLSHLREQQRLRSITISQVDQMTGLAFEHYLGNLLQSQGFRVEVTRASGDLGTDVVGQKAGQKYSIQAKRYSHPVDRTAISDAVAAMSYYKCNRSMVVTTNYFTKQALEFAKSTNTELVSRVTLADWIHQYRKLGNEISPIPQTAPADLAYKLAERHKAS